MAFGLNPNNFWQNGKNYPNLFCFSRNFNFCPAGFQRSHSFEYHVHKDIGKKQTQFKVFLFLIAYYMQYYIIYIYIYMHTVFNIATS